IVLDLRAQSLVARRHLRARAAERYGRPLMQWRAPERDAAPMLHAPVDAHARAALAAQPRRADAPSEAPPGGAWAGADAGRPPGVSLGSRDSEVVVRLFQPPIGTAWPLQTCLREADGTVHPVADLRAVGDLTTAGAAEASAAVMRLAPTVRGAAVDETGVDWL